MDTLFESLNPISFYIDHKNCRREYLEVKSSEYPLMESVFIVILNKQCSLTVCYINLCI